jgi:hypothetical protein
VVPDDEVPSARAHRSWAAGVGGLQRSMGACDPHSTLIRQCRRRTRRSALPLRAQGEAASPARTDHRRWPIESPCGLSLRLVPAACPCGLSLRLVPAACPCGLSLRLVPAAFHCGFSLPPHRRPDQRRTSTEAVITWSWAATHAECRPFRRAQRAHSVVSRRTPLLAGFHESTWGLHCSSSKC